MMTYAQLLEGFPVVAAEHCWTKRWVFPNDRFVTYEAKDEKWCRFFGIGHEVVEPGCYLLQLPGEPMTLLIHPTLLKQLKESMK